MTGFDKVSPRFTVSSENPSKVETNDLNKFKMIRFDHSHFESHTLNASLESVKRFSFDGLCLFFSRLFGDAPSEKELFIRVYAKIKEVDVGFLTTEQAENLSDNLLFLAGKCNSAYCNKKLIGTKLVVNIHGEEVFKTKLDALLDSKIKREPIKTRMQPQYSSPSQTTQQIAPKQSSTSTPPVENSAKNTEPSQTTPPVKIPRQVNKTQSSPNTRVNSTNGMQREPTKLEKGIVVDIVTDKDKVRQKQKIAQIDLTTELTNTFKKTNKKSP